MNRLALTIAGIAATIWGSAPHAQAPAAQAADQPVPREPPSNLQTGIYVDRYIGDASQSITRIARDTIMTRAILTAGDPLVPGPNGAVLRYRKEVVLGTMQPGEATALDGQPEQQVIYVEGGTGRIDDGEHYWALREGLVLLIPANARNRFTATGDQPLRMLMMSEPAHTDEKAARTILVRDLSKILYVEQGVHWTNLSKAPFTDVGERFLIVYMGPRTIAGPHAHTPETEEGWVKISEAPAWMQIGSEIRPWKANMGMIAPPNGQSVHAAINTSDAMQAFFYFATMPRPTPPPGAPARRPVSPVFEQSAVRATVAPSPLKALDR
jgi:mannose-6-phosphate isomerase-like protein (cupin superfamily)